MEASSAEALDPGTQDDLPPLGETQYLFKFPRDNLCKTAKILIVFILHPDAKDANVSSERQRSEGTSSPSRDDNHPSFMTPAAHSGGAVDESSKSSACLPEVGPCCAHGKQTRNTPGRRCDSLTSCFFRGGVKPAAFASAMERAASTTSWFTGSPARSRRKGRCSSATSARRACTWRKR